MTFIDRLSVRRIFVPLARAVSAVAVAALVILAPASASFATSHAHAHKKPAQAASATHTKKAAKKSSRHATVGKKSSHHSRAALTAPRHAKGRHDAAGPRLTKAQRRARARAIAHETPKQRRLRERRERRLARTQRAHAPRLDAVPAAATQWTEKAINTKVGPWVHSTAALIVNVLTGNVLFQRNADQVRPVASLTKMMTVLTFLDQKPNLEQAVTILPEDVRNASKTSMRGGEIVRLRDVLHSALMVSDNAAARTLARNAGMPMDQFIAHMNMRAQRMGLTHTRFIEPTGLDGGNVSTAREMAAIVHAATRDTCITNVMQKREYAYWSNRSYHHFGNTDHMLASQWDVKGGKTGYTSPAGYCFAACLGDGSGNEYASVVLGAPNKSTRFTDVKAMMSWASAKESAPPTK